MANVKLCFRKLKEDTVLKMNGSEWIGKMIIMVSDFLNIPIRPCDLTRIF